MGGYGVMKTMVKDTKETEEEMGIRNTSPEINVKELVDMLNQIADTDSTITLESIGTIHMPMVYYSKNDDNDWEARIIQRENKRSGLWDVNFEIVDNNQLVSNFSCDTFEIDKITHFESSGYFLIEFKEDNIEIIITYYDFQFVV